MLAVTSSSINLKREFRIYVPLLTALVSIPFCYSAALQKRPETVWFGIMLFLPISILILLDLLMLIRILASSAPKIRLDSPVDWAIPKQPQTKKHSRSIPEITNRIIPVLNTFSFFIPHYNKLHRIYSGSQYGIIKNSFFLSLDFFHAESGQSAWAIRQKSVFCWATRSRNKLWQSLNMNFPVRKLFLRNCWKNRNKDITPAVFCG